MCYQQRQHPMLWLALSVYRSVEADWATPEERWGEQRLPGAVMQLRLCVAIRHSPEIGRPPPPPWRLRQAAWAYVVGFLWV